MSIIKQLQKNNKFREILKKHNIGWRQFVKYTAFGVPFFENGKKLQAVCMGKFNHVYDYFICYIETKQIDYCEYKLVSIVEK